MQISKQHSFQGTFIAANNGSACRCPTARNKSRLNQPLSFFQRFLLVTLCVSALAVASGTEHEFVEHEQELLEEFNYGDGWSWDEVFVNDVPDEFDLGSGRSSGSDSSGSSSSDSDSDTEEPTTPEPTTPEPTTPEPTTPEPTTPEPTTPEPTTPEPTTPGPTTPDVTTPDTTTAVAKVQNYLDSKLIHIPLHIRLKTDR